MARRRHLKGKTVTIHIHVGGARKAPVHHRKCYIIVELLIEDVKQSVHYRKMLIIT